MIARRDAQVRTTKVAEMSAGAVIAQWSERIPRELSCHFASDEMSDRLIEITVLGRVRTGLNPVD